MTFAADGVPLSSRRGPGACPVARQTTVAVLTEATKGRVIVLTGAGGGLGAVMVTALLEAGHSIAAVDQDGNALVRLLERLQMPPDRLLPVAADVSSEDECNEAIETTAAHFGRVDGLSLIHI